jgi:uncharacterized protein YkwD
MPTSGAHHIDHAPPHRRLLRRVLLACLAVALTASAVAVISPSAGAATTTSMEAAVLKLINQERAAHHLKPMRVSIRLKISASRHNALMARANVLSHQLPGEGGLGYRVTKTTFPWNRLGENIGWNSDMSTAGALQLERMMYDEKAPNDGHRQNILSKTMNYVGVEVLLDPRHHKLWLTEDFGHYTP